MSVADPIIVAVLVISTATAFVKGFFVEVFSLAGLILGLTIAAAGYKELAARLTDMLHWTGLLQDFEIANLIAFVLIAFAVMLLAGMAGRLIRGAARHVGLGWIDRLLGAAFGFLKGCAIVTLVLMAVAAFLPQTDCLNNSRLAPVFLAAAHGSSRITPVELGEKIRQGVETLRMAQPEWWKPSAEKWTWGGTNEYAG